jgi:peroxiredoxin (alkyl hydroperoxide reductase subunit C)
METTLDRTETLKAGDTAPDFTLRDQDGNSVSLSDYQGKKNVVLVFHPLAFTSICSTQMPGYNKELQTFEGLETQVLGLSVDSSPAHRAWAEMLGGIDYPMLADFYPHGEVARKYGILRPEGISERATFVIDKEGKVRSIEVHDIGTLPDHQKLLETLRSIQ